MDRRFRTLWLATAVSNLGDGLRLAALPLLATRLTDDPRLIAGVAVAERLPWLLLILPGGVLADRLDRRKLRVRLDLVRAVIMGGLTVLVATGNSSMVAIYVVAALLASAEAVVDSSSMALIPALVDDEHLEKAGTQLNIAEMTFSAFVGPPLGGLLLGVALAAPFAVDASSFAIAALLMATLSGDFRATPPPTELATGSARSSMWSEIVEGMRWLWRAPSLRVLALISFGLGTISFFSGSVWVIYATKELKLSEFGYGLLIIPAAIGGMAFAAITPRLGKRAPLRWVLCISTVISGITHLVMAGSSNLILIGSMVALLDGMSSIWNILTLALRQREIPDHLLGRVGASYRMLVYVGMPFGALLGGIATEIMSVRWTIAVAGVVLIALGLAVLIALPNTKPPTEPARSATPWPPPQAAAST
jgi:MFS family permease